MSDAESEQPPTVQPTRRVYQERQYGRDVDLAARAIRIRAGVHAVSIGMVAGPLWGFAVSMVRGGNPLAWAIGFSVFTMLGVYFISLRMTMAAAAAAGTIHNPSGKSTPHKNEYSRELALLVQGKYGEAAEAFEIAALESDGDPEPYLQLARLYRDKLHQYDDALTWFRRARTDARLSSGQELLVIQEIIDLYTNKLGTPRKALPELITLCERFPETPAADGAELDIAEMREMMARELDGAVPFTAQYLESRRRRSGGAS
ncbi:MAG: hypothetical protein IH965_00685 [Gemmatimonadetes bacterium]|nr:hypothetical protein [Gemmatimonadota bacterium]